MKPPHPNRPSLIVALVLAFAGLSSAADAGPAALTTFELQDQFESSHKVVFPSERVTVLTIADRKGHEQVDAWVAALKPAIADRAAVIGIADMRGVPGPWRAGIRKKFRSRRPHPVLLDWSGEIAGKLPCRKDEANVFVFDRRGLLVGQVAGEATEASLRELTAAIEEAMKRPSS